MGRSWAGLGQGVQEQPSADQLAGRREGRAGPARSRPCIRPAARLLFKRLPPSLSSQSPHRALALPAFHLSQAPLRFRATPQPPPSCHGRCVPPRPAVSDPQPGADPHLPRSLPPWGCQLRSPAGQPRPGFPSKGPSGQGASVSRSELLWPDILPEIRGCLSGSGLFVSVPSYPSCSADLCPAVSI